MIFAGDGVGKVGAQDGPAHPPPPRPAKCLGLGQTTQVQSSPPDSASPHIVRVIFEADHLISNHGSLLREEQEELDWALDQLPHHRTKRFTFYWRTSRFFILILSENMPLFIYNQNK